MSFEKPEAHVTYRHTKTGNLYFVLGISQHTETGTHEVVYATSKGDFKLWHRPLSDHPKAWMTPNEDGSPRFVRLAK